MLNSSRLLLLNSSETFIRGSRIICVGVTYPNLKFMSQTGAIRSPDRKVAKIMDDTSNTKKMGSQTSTGAASPSESNTTSVMGKLTSWLAPSTKHVRQEEKKPPCHNDSKKFREFSTSTDKGGETHTAKDKLQSMESSAEETDKPLTRAQLAAIEVQETKDKYLRMSPSHKRKIYRCGETGFKTLDDVITWPLWAKSKRCRSVEDLSPIAAESEMDRQYLNMKIGIYTGDITALEIDAIVNAANQTLLGGGGVDGAIHRAAGNDLYKECKTLNGCNTGQAKITGGYKLPAKYIIHTVGPMGTSPKELADCYTNSLNLATEHHLRTIAFPCISTGIYGYPNLPAAATAIKAVRNWFETGDNADKMDRIIFCLFLPKDVECYNKVLPHFFPLQKVVKEESP